MANRGPSSFLLALLDEDKKVFTVVGPMTDDTTWNHRASEAQKHGRNVKFYGPLNKGVTKEQLIIETRTHTGYSYTEDSIL